MQLQVRDACSYEELVTLQMFHAIDFHLFTSSLANRLVVIVHKSRCKMFRYAVLDVKLASSTCYKSCDR
jgi:hypothetical protein